jgi:hypothetical protein
MSLPVCPICLHGIGLIALKNPLIELKKDQKRTNEDHRCRAQPANL